MLNNMRLDNDMQRIKLCAKILGQSQRPLLIRAAAIYSHSIVAGGLEDTS